MPLMLHSTEYEKAVIGQKKNSPERKGRQIILQTFTSFLQNLHFKQQKNTQNILLHEWILTLKLIETL